MKRKARSVGGPGGQSSANAPRVRLRSFSNSLPMSLLRAREAVMRHFRASLRHYDLTEQQWRVLRALSSIQEIEVSRLAKAVFLLGPSLSRILRDLEQRELVERRADGSDMRVGLIRLSPKGARVIEEVSPDSERIYNEITARFGQEKLDRLQKMLSELEASLSHDEPAEGSSAHETDGG